MQPPDTFPEAKLWAAAIGAVGAAFSMAFIKDLTPWQKAVMVLVGAVIAALFTQPIIELIGMPPGWRDGAAFLVGMFGWAIAGSILTMIRKADWWELAKEVIRSWLVRKGG
ncbi:hypothetical protein ERD78_18935 [Allopusillimonas soli]|uniref:Holin n=1 Tax=Allopusillimonas soli TaxID=659016 RepID=A0A853FDE8_9BURK|nr:hypothetical protein [Allopusillimonas soli]NYT38855.1 hypothetical protein [Allopusillimonas soli]TEA70145.1 hypothetical protein ERD78_18935 [Allopusillimonas soli]